MLTSTNYLQQLLQRYADNDCTRSELLELLQIIDQSLQDEELHLALSSIWQQVSSADHLPILDKEKIFTNSITATTTLARVSNPYPEYTAPVHRIHFLKTSWFRYAAAVVLLIGGAALWWEISRSARNDGAGKPTVIQTADIAPGTNRAILTIGNQSINLSNKKTGIAVGKAVTYNDGERIADAGQLLQLNTPRGGQYQAVLPDGTKVWLNAASSIKFPSKFTTGIREVEVIGEAYLEVAKNTKQPFYVHTNRETIQVLGTSFNVNAYADEEEEKTTLIEGSVRIAGVILKPNQQAIIKGEAVNVQQADIEQALAWKNNIFNFNDVDIKAMMRQLSRWYDVEVVYKDNVPERRFLGEMPRSMSLDAVLRVLERSNVHFSVEGKRIIVKP